MADTPSFLVAAKSHSALNNGDTGDDSIIGDIGSTISDAVSSSLTFTGLAIGAGLTEAWNVFPTIGNWLGGEFDRIDYKAQLADLDSDLSKYYTDHKLGIDTVGFIVGSFIPGMAGVKVLRAGQFLLYFSLGNTQRSEWYDVVDNNVGLPALNIARINDDPNDNMGLFSLPFKIKIND